MAEENYDASLPVTDVPPLPEHWTAEFKRVPSEYLVEAGGDVKIAAYKAGVDEASFLRALGSDNSIAQVARSAHFLMIMHSLDLATMAKEEIARRFVEAPDPTDDPASDDYDPQIANPAALFDVKTLISLFKFSGEFIALAAQTALAPQRTPGTNRHTPPRIGKVIEAGRGLPSASPRGPSQEDRIAHPNPEFSRDPSATPNLPDPQHEARAALDTMAARLANSPPEVRALFQEALDKAAAAEDEDLDGDD
jgi:hypothetical protein